MATKNKTFMVYTSPDPQRRVRRGEVVPLARITLACPLCGVEKCWHIMITQRGIEAACEVCNIAAFSVRVSYSDKSVRAANHRNKKGHTNAA